MPLHFCCIRLVGESEDGFGKASYASHDAGSLDIMFIGDTLQFGQYVLAGEQT